jgi:hypothetical protein
MELKREWTTPLVIGIFLLSGVTGIMLFFDKATLLGKNAHMYVGLLFVAGVIAHVISNLFAFKRYLAKTNTRVIVGIFAVILVATFGPFGPQMPAGGQQGMRKFMDAALNAPVSELAVLVKRDPNTLVQNLRAAGYDIKDPSQSLISATGATGEGQQVKALNAISVLMQ